MASNVLDMLQKRVQTLADNVLRIESDIQHTQAQLKQQQAALTRAEQAGNVAEVRLCLTLIQSLEMQLPNLDTRLNKLLQSQRLFARQLEQHQAVAETA